MASAGRFCSPTIPSNWPSGIAAGAGRSPAVLRNLKSNKTESLALRQPGTDPFSEAGDSAKRDLPARLSEPEEYPAEGEPR